MNEELLPSIEDLSGFDLREELRVFRHINESRKRDIKRLTKLATEANDELNIYKNYLDSMYELWKEK